MQQKKIIIAVDGFSSCGKSTIAKGLAKELGYKYIDTGAMYRGVAFYAMRKGWIGKEGIEEQQLKAHIADIEISFHSNEKGAQETYLNGENVEKEIRSLEVANAASRVSALPFVRRELVRQQQMMGKRKGGDGWSRYWDGCFSEAELKLFITAKPRCVPTEV